MAQHSTPCFHYLDRLTARASLTDLARPPPTWMANRRRGRLPPLLGSARLHAQPSCARRPLYHPLFPLWRNGPAQARSTPRRSSCGRSIARGTLTETRSNSPRSTRQAKTSPRDFRPGTSGANRGRLTSPVSNLQAGTAELSRSTSFTTAAARDGYVLTSPI